MTADAVEQADRDDRHDDVLAAVDHVREQGAVRADLGPLHVGHYLPKWTPGQH